MARLSKKTLPLAAVALTLALALMLTPATRIDAADHGDAPYGNSDQGIDGADAYAFLDPTDNTRVILSLTSRGFIAAGENNNFGQFDPAVRYRFELETTLDARPDRFIDVTFSRRRVPGDPAQQNAQQIATVTLPNGQTFTAPTTPPSVCISGSANCPPAPIITEFTSSSGVVVRFFAGMRDDTFQFDIPGFAGGTAALRACVAGTNTSPTCVADALDILNRGRDSFAGYNIMNIALSIPRALLTAVGVQNELGVNAALQRRTPQLFLGSPDQVAPGRNYPAVGFGRWVTLDRVGNPAINAVIVPFNRKDEYNAATPQDDASGRFAGDIVAALTALGTNSTNIGILAGVVVTRGDILRLNLNTPNTSLGMGETILTTGYTGFPNGRRPGDDVVDVILYFVANQPQPPTIVTDGANVNEVPIPNTFPFFSPPHQPQPRGTGAEDFTRN
ncbi:DUF4331 domain-containing protein [soil metagenome]